MSDIEGKVAREAMSECGQRASFKTFGVASEKEGIFEMEAGAGSIAKLLLQISCDWKARPLLCIRYGGKLGEADSQCYT